MTPVVPLLRRFFRYLRSLSRLRKRKRSLAHLRLAVFTFSVIVGVLFLSFAWKKGLDKIRQRRGSDGNENVLESIVGRSRQMWERPHGNLLGGGEWESVMNDVVVGVKTGHEVAEQRLNKLRKMGWYSVGRTVPNMVVISDTVDEKLGVAGAKEYAWGVFGNGTAIPEHWFEKTGWRGDKDKNLPALHMMRWAFPGKRWYLLLDDDTYIFLDNFARYIKKDVMDATPIYTGRVFYISRCGGFERDGTWAANRSEPKGMFAHGGSGIVVNGVAMDKLWPRIGECIAEFGTCWAGDMQVGLCMRKSGVNLRKRGGKIGYERHFIQFWPSKSLADKRFIHSWLGMEEPITFHKMPDNELRLLSEFETMKVRQGGIVKYAELRKHLLGNGVIPLNSTRNKLNKFYTEVFIPKPMVRQ